jgi:mannan endo-1,4-beta-mannosidase
MLNGKPFRFVGANVAVMYRNEERAYMVETLREAARDGVKVVRVWSHGEGNEPLSQETQWRQNPFRFSPDKWNEEAFVHLDHIIAEAAKNKLFVQLCLLNWWRDTGGVTEYLKWAGITDAADDKAPFGINIEKAMAFYSNEKTRQMYKNFVQRLVLRRNIVTGVVYRDDPTIFAWELVNEAQVPTGRWHERKAWVEEMSLYLRSLDQNHLIASGTWGYRNAIERRAWIDEHSLPSIDFADIHNYPRDDADAFVDSPDALKEFLENRVAAACLLNKPLVIGEFGMTLDGYKGVSQVEWFRSYFEQSARLGAAGALVWVYTFDPKSGYSISFKTSRDDAIRAEIKRGAELMSLLQDTDTPDWLKKSDQHLIPRQFAFERPANDPIIKPQIIGLDQDRILYRFRPEAVSSGRFERVGGGDGYVWGLGMGFFDYVVPEREKSKTVNSIVVRAALKPVEPWDSHGRIKQSNVTLFVNGANCGTRLVELPPTDKANVYEWTIDSWALTWQAGRGEKLLIRLAVEPTAEHPYGVTIANFPFDSKGVTPIEIELR